MDKINKRVIIEYLLEEWKEDEITAEVFIDTIEMLYDRQITFERFLRFCRATNCCKKLKSSENIKESLKYIPE